MRLAVVALLLAGCVKANLVVVDKKTALEAQAAGSFPSLDEELEQAGIVPRPRPLLRGELEAAGAPAPESLSPTDDAAESQAPEDALLRRRCIGEANDGTLVDTRERCSGSVDVAAVGKLLEGENRARWQIWRWLQQKQPGATLEQVRRAWLKTHREGVVCGGQVQRDDGTWELKAC